MPVAIGGRTVTTEAADAALAVLRSAPGMMVRQPLTRAGSPLASCDYHAAARPFLDPAMAPTGRRGAGGRQLTKTAFMAALESAIALARLTEQAEDESRRRLSALAPGAVEAAMAAFRADHSYAALMADAAVGSLRKKHEAGLRAILREASQRAIMTCASLSGSFRCGVRAACGTGECRFACSALAALSPAAGRPRGAVLRRPDNHVQAGEHFSPDAMLDSLLSRQPFQVIAA